jgi:hypothetical protein
MVVPPTEIDPKPIHERALRSKGRFAKPGAFPKAAQLSTKGLLTTLSTEAPLKKLISLTLLGLAATASACDQQATVTDLDLKPLFSFENAPDNTGVVVRYDNVEQGLIWSDYEYVVYLGIDPRTSTCLGEFYNDGHWDMQRVNAPSESAHYKLLGEQVLTSVWPGGVDCDYIMSNDPIGEGLSNFKQTATYGHTWNYQAQGRLTTPTGDYVNFHAREHWARGHNGWKGTYAITMTFKGGR